MLNGKYSHNLDSKNRLIVPVRLREDLGESFMVSKWLDGCLAIFPMDRWNEMMDRIMKIPSTNKDVRMFSRMLSANSQECSFDSLGRIQLSGFMIKDAALKKACMMIGATEHVGSWA